MRSLLINNNERENQVYHTVTLNVDMTTVKDGMVDSAIRAFKAKHFYLFNCCNLVRERSKMQYHTYQVRIEYEFAMSEQQFLLLQIHG